MNVMTTPKFGMGASVLRKEDNAFITGRGRYTDDISPPGTLYGYVLRSPAANAKSVEKSNVSAVRASRRTMPNACTRGRADIGQDSMMWGWDGDAA